VSLEALLRLSDFKVVAVVTQPDRPKGRDLKLQASPVKELALKHGLPVLQPQKARDEAFIGELRSLGPDLIVVAAFGQILPKAMLEIPPYGCINVHTSLLPKYRGAGPIQWAILNDEKETGVTIMKMDVGMDTGDVITQDRTEITPEDNAQTLHERLAQMGAELLVRTIPDYVAGKIQPRPQPAEGVSLAPKIKKEEGRIDWQQPARVIWNRVRGLVPWPGAFTVLKEGQRLLKIWEAEIVEGKSGKPGEILDLDRTGIVVGCGDGAIRLTMVQLEGGKRLSAEQFLAGNRKAVGQGLG